MSKDPDTGKSLQAQAEDAWDEIAEREGIDDYGDPIAVDDDEPALEASEETSEDVEEAEIEETSEEVEPDETEITASGEEDSEEPAEALEPPVTWSDEWKGGFESIPTEGQKILLDMNANMNKAFTQKMEQLALIRREQEGLHQALTPHMERLQLDGITPEVAIQRALGWDKIITDEGPAGILKYAAAKGIDLSAHIQQQGQEDTYLTPAERQARDNWNAQQQQLQYLNARLQQYEQHQQQMTEGQYRARVQSELETFMNAKDEAGNLLHPYLNELAPRMAELVKANQHLTLEQSYKLAVDEVPEVRKALDKKRKAIRAAEDKKRVDKVRKASQSGIVSKSAGKTSDKTPLNTEQLVAAAYEQNANAR